MIDCDGEWRETAGGKARELVAPSEAWLRRAAEDPDAALVYAEANGRLGATGSGPVDDVETTTEGS